MQAVGANRDDGLRSDAFSAFVGEHERALRRALTARFGVEVGREATAEALLYGWQHWDRVESMDNPVGYLFAVGRDRGSKMAGRVRRLFPAEGPVDSSPWVEPHLASAVAGLSDRQRTVVLLLYGFEWSQSEVAEVLGISKGTVQRHAERGMARLRRKLGVEA